MSSPVQPDPALAAVLDTLCRYSGEDWSVQHVPGTDLHALLLDGTTILTGLREDVLNYMLAYTGGIQCAWRDFTARCPAMGNC